MHTRLYRRSFYSQAIFIRLTFLALLGMGIFACQPAPFSEPAPSVLPQYSTLTPVNGTNSLTKLASSPVRTIPLTGRISSPEAELSGLAWDRDTLLLLPQYPERFTLATAPDSAGAIFAISRGEILTFLDGKINTPLDPRLIPIYAPDLHQKLAGYEGFESILAAGERVYFSIETNQASGMVGILLAGEFNGDHSEIHIDTDNLEAISAQASIPNFSDEALTRVNQQLVTFYEANGAQVNPDPIAHMFNFFLEPQRVIFSPNLEYRITDATLADEQGRFWVMNYFFPGDTKIAPLSDPIKEKYGVPPDQIQAEVVERLVQFQWHEDQVFLTDLPPIYLELLPDGTARNWEGLAQLDERGFLLVTDRYPKTVFGFVQYP